MPEKIDVETQRLLNWIEGIRESVLEVEMTKRFEGMQTADLVTLWEFKDRMSLTKKEIEVLRSVVRVRKNITSDTPNWKEVRVIPDAAVDWWSAPR